ncbi:MAG: hypothetical protein CMO80_00180 [Verrucomicrobiales bacterium]|nr:hypothetical protein [Verrucomicrobiales bacterium]
MIEMEEKEQPNYRKLGGGGRYSDAPELVLFFLFFVFNIFVLLFYKRRTLYLGPDHLLVVEGSSYSETYKFYNFRDIHSFTLRRTYDYIGWMITLALAVAVLLWLAITPGDDVANIVFGSLAGIVGAVLLVHLLRGRTVHCELKTAVSSVYLPSLGRLGHAQKVLSQIRQLIEEEQGAFDPDDFERANSPAPGPEPAVVPAQVENEAVDATPIETPKEE